MKLKLLFTLFLLTISTIGLTQRFDYDNTSKIFFGLNLGRTWHTSDVQNVEDRFPLGGGFIFGGSINQNYGNLFSYDLRLRYLTGNWYGQDNDTTSAIGSNEAVKKVYGSTGFAVQNFQASQHVLDLELAIHANRFRERTGLDPYLFAGIGVTATLTRGDLMNFANTYDYSSNPTGNQIAQEYDTPLDKNSEGEPYSDEEFESNILPSLGIGLGYYFNSRFSIGVEHKSTFFTNDYFDGTTTNQNGQPSDFMNNDIYHYTSVYFRWYLKKRNRSSAPVEDNDVRVIDNNSNTNINDYTDNTRKQPPMVNFTNPSNSPHTVNSPTFILNADIKFVELSQNVTFRQDGAVNHSFTYNPLTDKFQSTVQLKPGKNVFWLRGTNNHGSDEETMIINYRRDVVVKPLPPVVDIIDPSANPEHVSTPTYLLTADVENITNNNQLTVIFNGQPLTNYNFTPGGVNNFTTSLKLKEGVNTFKITGTNNVGSDSDQTTIIYRRTVNVHPPVVTYTNPSHSPIDVTNSNFNLKGNVKYVDGKDQVTFVQNGIKNYNFSYNAGTDQFSSSVVLKPGQNIFQLIGTNQAGSDQATVIINYKVEQPKPPIVSILNPSMNPFMAYNNTKSFKASVLNVTNASQVKVTLNGDPFASYNFDVATGVLTSVLPLQIGSNVITVTGTNPHGSDSKQTTIIYHEAKNPQPPIVEYVVPSSNPHQTNTNSQFVRATVQNVSNSGQINVNVNGTNVPFNFNLPVVEFTASLIEGVNTVTVTGTNNDGTDSETLTIIYQKLEQPIPPVVTYIDPLSNPKTVFNSLYAVEAKVKNVTGQSDIALRINGVPTNNFNYSVTSEIMTFNAGLILGANIIEITATNQHGQDVETTSIIYKKSSPVLPPDVNITNPSTTNYVTSQPNKAIEATVLNVASKQEIFVEFNGSNLSNFTYNNSTKEVQFNVNLIAGNNNVVITATNNAGSDTDSRKIIYDPEEKVDPPHVVFVNPSSPGQVVYNPTFQMVAEVKNVDSKNDIEVRFNGIEVNSNLYTFNPSTKEVNYNTNLSLGNNVFQVRGTNVAGTHQATTNILFKKAQDDCDKPEIAFNDPSTNNIVTNQDYYNLSALVEGVANSSDITLLVNGITIGSFMYAPATHIFIRKVDLMEGNNVIEIIAENDCGKTDKSVSIKYVVKEAPCFEPTIAPINPSGYTFSTQNSTFNFKAATSNIENTQQIRFEINGTPANFNFDLGTHEVSAQINLQEGQNNLVLAAENRCGEIMKVWKITRVVCHEPALSLTTVPQITANPLPDVNFQISGTISDVVTAGISVTHNGAPVNFVYDETNENFNLSVNLEVGSNVINIEATNECGSGSKTFKVNHEPIVIETPPTVNITTPGNNPMTTSNASQSIVANTTNVSSNNQVNVTVNNSNVNFNFNASTGVISFVHPLTSGNNLVEINVSNAHGSASDQTMIVYEEPIVVQPPVVTFTSPTSSPSIVSAGTHTVSGKVTNLTSANQLQLIVNNQPFSGHTVSIQNGVLQFTFNIPVNATHPVYDITAIGTNSAGSDQATSSIQLEEETEDPNCMPTVGATFGNNHKSVTATSTMDLSNVVLKFSDNTTQKFENLSGNSIVLSGTGANVDKCIIGVWVKSGCNQSGDGPGYGEWIENSGYNGSCETAPCDPPVINLLSNTDVANSSYTLNIFIDNVTTNQVSIAHNGTPINCNFNAGSQTFSCLVNLSQGANVFEVVANGCETVSKTFTVNYTIPCSPVTFNRTYPAQQNLTVTDDHINITLNAQHQNTVSATVNGSPHGNITSSGNNIIINNVALNSGINNIVVSLVNDCSQKSVNYSINYTPPSTCGPRINPGNAAWQFCLVTPSGTYSRDDLASNSNFTYTGPASSLYFMAIAGGGDATVNGVNYPIQTGRYYLFEGNITVSVSTTHPGSMGHWQVCVDASSAPQSGNGGNRPPSPCEEKTNQSNSPVRPPREKPTRTTNPEIEKAPVEPSKPVRESKPQIENKPKRESKPPVNTRTRPTQNKPNVEPEKEKEPTRSSPKVSPERGQPTRRPPSGTSGPGGR